MSSRGLQLVDVAPRWTPWSAGRARSSARRGTAPAARAAGRGRSRGGAACRRSKVDTTLPRRSQSPTISSTWRSRGSNAARARRTGRRGSAGSARRQVVVRVVSWNTRPMLRRTVSRSGRRHDRQPWRYPRSGPPGAEDLDRWWTCRRRSGPRKPKVSPVDTSKSMPRTASVSPCTSRSRALTEIAGVTRCESSSASWSSAARIRYSARRVSARILPACWTCGRGARLGHLRHGHHDLVDRVPQLDLGRR